MSTVHQLSPAAEAALATARESGRAQGIEEGRAQWAEYVNGAAEAAAFQANKAQQVALGAERAHHKRLLDAHGWGMLAYGAVGGLVAGAVAASTFIAYTITNQQLTTAAARGIEQRGGTSVLPAPTLCDPATETCLPDTLDRDTGYDRPGRAPRSAP